nr:hypothetical protein BaRGS_021374 [Batillaria attramentaria]
MAGCKYKLKWFDHLNSSWVTEDCESITYEDDLNALYERLLDNKEVILFPPQAINISGPSLPAFDTESFTVDEQDHLLDSLLASQLFLASVVYSNTPFSLKLRKRQLVLQRIYHAVSQKFHTRQEVSQKAVDAQPNSLASSREKAGVLAVSGSDALIELGVKTGLSLLFSLFRQNWQLSRQTGQLSFCNEVLQTAISIVSSLPPLSLANENRLTSLGTDSLNQVTQFLRSAASPQAGADPTGQQLAAELMLQLTAQRGLLHFLLEWVDLALHVSAAARSEEKRSGGIERQLGRVGRQFFHKVLSDMVQSVLQHLAEDYTNSCIGPDTNTNNRDTSSSSAAASSTTTAATTSSSSSSDNNANNTASSSSSTSGSGGVPGHSRPSVITSVSGSARSVSGREDCEVYVWGSNNSHQLAEGSQEKILTPKLTSSFKHCQQIEAGQFCTFLIHNDLTVSACGKGSYGRLGLGDSNNQALPMKLVFEPKHGIKKISSSKGSDGHTLALSVEGEVFSWGDGHGDKASCTVPKLVKDIGEVGQVACGSVHTVAVSQDGKTVWSFGSGDNGKLGHGDMNRYNKPRVIEAFAGMHIRKVACSGQSSLALTSTGQVYAWGSGSCIGCGVAEFTALRPKLIEDLQNIRIVDISSGDSHCLALSHDNEVYAWGNNAMGQCGQGHSQSPITRPRKVVGLEGVMVQQISAGTSHSVAWTALPSDRHVIAWHRPFCVDLQEATFAMLCSFLERYCDGFDVADPPPPFTSRHEVLGKQTQPLRNLLFRLVDTSTPDCIQQRMQLGIVLTSLQDNMHVATVLGLTASGVAAGDSAHETENEDVRRRQELAVTQNLQLAELLMKTILRNLAAHTVGLVAKHLQQHLLLLLPVCAEIINHATGIIKFSSAGSPDFHSQLEDVLLMSPAGDMLTHIMTALVVVPVPLVVPVLHEVVALLPCLDTLCRSLPYTSRLELSQLEPSDKSSEDLHGLPWSWMVDLERTCALLIGLCIGSMLHGPPIMPCETQSSFWLAQQLFSNGLNMSVRQLEKLTNSICESVEEGYSERRHLDLDLNLEEETNKLLDLGMGVTTPATVHIMNMMQSYALDQDLDTCELGSEVMLDTVTRFYLAALFRHGNLLSVALDSDEPTSQLESMFLLVYKLRSKLVSYRQPFSTPTAQSSPNPHSKHAVIEGDGGDDHVVSGVQPRGEGLNDSTETIDLDRERRDSDDDDDQEGTIQGDREELSYSEVARRFLQRCIFLLLAVRPPIAEETVSLLQKSDPEKGQSSASTHSTSSPRRRQRRGSLPDISVDLQNEQAQPLREREGVATPTLNSWNVQHLSPQLNSLQKVKEMLRRLRWQQERLHGRSHGQGHDLSPDPAGYPRSMSAEVRPGPWAAEIATFVSCEQRSGRLDEVEPLEVARAMVVQQERAESRLYALNQVLELLTTAQEKEQEGTEGPVTTSTTLLNSTHLQLLAGCFGLGSTPDFHILGSHSQLYHYQDLIKTAKAQTQQEIQLAVHRVYEVLIASLVRTHQSSDPALNTRTQLLLSSILALSVKYLPVDISLVVSCRLPATLLELCAPAAMMVPLTLPPVSTCLQPVHMSAILHVASMRLLQIIALSTGRQLCGSFSGGGFPGVSEARVLQPHRSTPPDEPRWLKALLTIISGTDDRGRLYVDNLRVRLLALQLLTAVLPACDKETDSSTVDFKREVVEELFQSLSDVFWKIPLATAAAATQRKKATLLKGAESLSSSSATTAATTQTTTSITGTLGSSREQSGLTTGTLASCREQNGLASVPASTVFSAGTNVRGTTPGCNKRDAARDQEQVEVEGVMFDPDRCVSCSVENGHTVAHGSGGRGYALASTPMTSGCYQWKFHIVKENRGNEGTCVGVARWPVRDCGHRTTSDMWLYRAYSGNLYHEGELRQALPRFTQGDVITAVLDMDARTLSFARNDQEPQIAFEDLDACELFPVVTFYSSSPGEKVKISDMQVRSTPRELLAGDPMCAPSAAAMTEALVVLLRELHSTAAWAPYVAAKICSTLDAASTWQIAKNASGDGGQTGGRKSQAQSLDSSDEKTEGEKTEKNEEEKTEEEKTEEEKREIEAREEGEEEKTEEEKMAEDAESRVEMPQLNLDALNGLQARHLHAIMNVAFLREGRLRGDSDANSSSSKAPDSNTSSRKKKEELLAKQAAETEQLMKELDRDIARMLDDDLDSYDHNADKKEYFDEKPAAGKVSSKEVDMITDLTHSREFQAVKLAAVQLVAVKALSNIISCSRFQELLLVPCATLQSDSSPDKSLLEDLAFHQDEDLKMAVRSVVRHLVHRATLPSPFRRSVSLAELERSFTVLHSDIVRTLVEERLGMPSLDELFTVALFGD